MSDRYSSASNPSRSSRYGDGDGRDRQRADGRPRAAFDDRHRRRGDPEVTRYERGHPSRRDDHTSTDRHRQDHALQDPSRTGRRRSASPPPRKVVTFATQDAARNDDVADDADADADESFEMLDEEEEERRIQEQRRKRKEMMEAYERERERERQAKSSGTPDAPAPGNTTTQAASTSTSASTSTPTSAGPTAPSTPSMPATLSKPADVGASTAASTVTTDAISAAEYDPSMDRSRSDQRAADAAADGIGEPANTVAGDNDDSEYEEIEVEDSDDDGAGGDGIDDMFAVSDNDDDDDGGGGQKKMKRVRVKKGSRLQQETSNAPFATQTHPALTDNFDDAEGYYRIVLGERIGPNGRYHVFALLGKGMFSEVVRAKDLGLDGKGSNDVAIKIVRSQETMYKAGQKEISILKRLEAHDPADKRHIIRLLSHFDHRGHLCMVFENLNMNLRDVVKRFGKDVGLNLGAVRAYTHQILLGLSLMKRAGIMHADVKPDNILVNESKTVLKICDLGSAADMSPSSSMEITPYLVSRFYRAPEIILGAQYDCALDMWSVGCTLYELYTGKILFPGRSNNHMLLLIQELKGRITAKQIRKGSFASAHFDATNAFLSVPVAGGGAPTRLTLPSNPPNDLRARLLPPRIAKQLPDAEVKLTLHFIDLLNRMLELDPAKRIQPNDALKHPFLA